MKHRTRAAWLGGALLLGLGQAASAQQVVRMPTAAEAGAKSSAMRVINALSDLPTSRQANGHRVDEWAALIKHAATRFGIPDQWIREVMRMESGGNPRALSHAGAMGLMQVIPGTYARMRWQHGLGADPWDPHNNILAGAAYIREMYDLYGYPAFLAAYNAGPGRVDGFLNSRSVLPAETVNYLSVLAPRLQGTTIAEGPLAAFVPQTGQAPSLAARSASPGPLMVNMRQPQAAAQASLASANGLVPRGMLNGPQTIQMPKLNASFAAPVELPPEVVRTLLRTAPRR